MPAILQRSVSLKMSTDKVTAKSEETMGDEKDIKEEEKPETKTAADGKESEENKEKETPKKRSAKVKEVKKEEEEDDDEEEEDSDDDNEEGDAETENDTSTKVPLLDQPLQLSGTRERKKVQRFTEEFKSEAKDTTVEIPEGKGTALGSIPRIDAEIQRTKADGLKALHKVLFGRVGKSTLVKKNIRKFNGFDYDKDSDLFEKKKAIVQKMESKVLKSLCGILDLEKKGNREEQAERILKFLLEPKDSGKPVPAPRPKRKSAVKANSKGYSESEDDEKRPTRSPRGKSKRANLKEDSSSESEVEASPPKKKEEKESDKEKESDEEMEEEEEDSASDSDERRSRKKNKTANAKKGTTKKGTKKPANKKAEKKPTPKKKKSASKSDADDNSSSEDEPLAKKAKNPPTDEEIKAYVKEILEGANLEEITMKTVCKQVYAHYPEFDLAHKKDFIKSTVKSLIST